MENYFYFLGGPIIAGVLGFLLFWLMHEMDMRVESVTFKLFVLAPLMVSFVLIAPVLVSLGFGVVAFYPLFASYVWLVTIALGVVLTKPVRTYSAQ